MTDLNDMNAAHQQAMEHRRTAWARADEKPWDDKLIDYAHDADQLEIEAWLEMYRAWQRETLRRRVAHLALAASGPPVTTCSNLRTHAPHIWHERHNGFEHNCPGRETDDV